MLFIPESEVVLLAHHVSGAIDPLLMKDFVSMYKWGPRVFHLEET